MSRISLERENVFEWYEGQKTISVTLYSRRLIHKVQKLAERYPDQVQILASNPDGSIFAHLPLKSLKLNIISRNVSGFFGKNVNAEVRVND